MTVTDPAHLAAAKQLRQQYLDPTQPVPVGGDELARDLADYDRAFGLLDGALERETLCAVEELTDGSTGGKADGEVA